MELGQGRYWFESNSFSCLHMVAFIVHHRTYRLPLFWSCILSWKCQSRWMISSTVKRSNQVKEDCAEHSESTDLNTLYLLILDVVTTKVGLFIWLRLAPRLVWQCLRPETFSKPKIHRCSRHRTEPRADHTFCAMTDAIFMRGISVTLDKANNKSIPNRGYLQCGCI